MPRKPICDLAPNEWYDGTGTLRSEKWAVLVTTRRREGGGDNMAVYGSVMGTRGQAEELLADMANGWAREDGLAIIQIFEPEIVEYKATVTWPDKTEAATEGEKP